MGVDNRPDEPVARTDTIMVLSINPQTGQAGMVSLARDLLVEIPGMNQMAKINTAHLYGEVNKYPGGGPGLLRATVGDFLGYKPDYWVRINFEGFRDIIDQIGGIDIVVPKAISDPLYPDEAYGYDPLYIPAGRIHMNGALALKYARTRHVDSDYGRARRQQQVVMVVKDKLMQPSNLANLLTHLPGLAITMAKSVQTDMPVNKAIDLAKAINEAGTGSIQTAVIDDKLGTNSNDPTWGFVLVPDLPRVRAAVAGAFGDGPVSQPAAQLSDPAVAEEGARVAVLNGTTQIDLATRVATNLSAEGYTVIGVGNADRQNYAQSFLITHGNAAPATCAALAQALSIPVDRIRNEATDTNADVVLVIGADLARTQASLLRAVP
jgi:LCP family protein required for cell wall assembly